MKLNLVSNEELKSRLEQLVRNERKITHLVLCHILEFEDRRLYAELGYDSMFSYLTEFLGYSEHSAYRRLQSARVLRIAPDVADRLEEGSLNLSQLTQVQKCLSLARKRGDARPAENIQNVLNKIESKNSFDTQKFLAVEFNLPVKTITKVTSQSDSTVRLELTLTSDQFLSLNTAKELLSHVCIDGDWASIITKLAEKFNHSKLGSSKNSDFTFPQSDCPDSGPNFEVRSERECAKGPTTQGVITMPNGRRESCNLSRVRNTAHCSIRPRRRSAISLIVKRRLLKKANHSCQYTSSTGHRCGSRFQLQIDHRIPMMLGGSNDEGNLRVLCRTHNIYSASDAATLK